MARKLYEKQAIRRRTGALANGVVLVVYTDAAGTTLADISATVGGSAIAGSTVTTADIAGLGPAALRFYGPTDGTDILYMRVPSDTSLGVQKIEADTDPRLDALEAGVGGGGIAATVFDAKGDLIAASAADTAARFAVGADGAGLVSDSAAATGLKWLGAEVFNVKAPPYNAVGDGVADDTAEIQAAIDAATTAGGGMVLFPPGTYKVTSLTPTPGVYLWGSGGFGQTTHAVTLLGTAGSDIVTLPTSGGYSSFHIANLHFKNGRRHIFGSTQHTFVHIDRCYFDAPSAECISLADQNEEWRITNCVFSGGTYGFRFNNTGVNPLFDKSIFQGCVFGGASINAIRIEVALSGGVLFNQCTFNTTGQHAVYLDGGISSMTFLACITEGTGQTGKSNRTTGTVGAGATALTVASGTGLANGDPIVVAGAGTDGKDHYTTIASGGGTTSIVLTAATILAVTNARVTNGSYDDFFLANSISNPNYLSWIGGAIGNEGSGGHLRYAINNTIASHIVVIGTTATATIPIYDPGIRVSGMSNGMPIRTPSGWSARYPLGLSVFSGASGGESNKAIVASPPGRPLTLWMTDSTLDATGTPGTLEVRHADTNRTLVFEVQADGDVVHWGLAGSVLYSNRNFALRTTDLGAGSGVFAIANAATAPTTNPTGGGVLYTEGGVLKYRGSGGTITVIGSA